MFSGQRNRGGFATFFVGALFGFFVATTLSGMISIHIGDDDEKVHPQVALAALRELSTVRHFPERDGWGLIHVFNGNESHDFEAKDSTKWFGQFHQDSLISRLLNGKRDGYFVDMGASDAIKASNTFALESRFGWKGVCVEPNPHYWESLSYRNCDVVGAVVGDSKMQHVSFRYPHQRKSSGGIVGAEFDIRKPSQDEGEDHSRYTVTLREILQRFEAPRVIDYLSLDVEGAEKLVLKNFPFSRYRFKVITVERPSRLLQDVLIKNGYFQLKEINHSIGEFLWIHQSIQHSLDMSA